MAILMLRSAWTSSTSSSDLAANNDVIVRGTIYYLPTELGYDTTNLAGERDLMVVLLLSLLLERIPAVNALLEKEYFTNPSNEDFAVK